MSRQQPKPYPLYNTTFTLHRVSPLHSESLTPAILYHHSYAFRNILAGDNLRGVQIGLDPSDTALTRVGALKSVTWKLLGSIEEYENDRDNAEPSEQSSLLSEDKGWVENGGRGVWISIVYEKAEYTALLLRRNPEDVEAVRRNVAGDQEGFTKYPVLASRMPAGLRQTLIGYLQDNFDVRIASLNLDKKMLIGTLDTFLEGIFDGMGESGGKRVIRDVLVTFAFAPSGSLAQAEADDALKTIDVTIARDDVHQFVAKGQKIEEASDMPFWTALALYCQKHMALDINHEAVRVGKIACGAWVLGKDGKMKVFEPTAIGGENAESNGELWRGAVDRVVESIIGVAEGGMLGG